MRGKEQEKDEELFYQPTREMLESGLACNDPECSGQYVPKRRDITMKRKRGSVVIRDTEYWECEVCGGFVTAREEVERIRKESRQQNQYTGRLTLRLDPALHQEIAERAKANHRSLNNEIAYRLKESLGNS